MPSSGDLKCPVQSPGLIENVKKNQAKLAADILRAGERLNAIFGVSCDPPLRLLIP